MAASPSTTALALHHIAIPSATKDFWMKMFALPLIKQNINYTGWIQLGATQLHCISGGAGAGRHALEITLSQARHKEAVTRLREGNFLVSEAPIVAIDPVGTHIFLRVRDTDEDAVAHAHEVEVTRIVSRSEDVRAVSVVLEDVLGLPRAENVIPGGSAFEIAGLVPGARCVLEVVEATPADGRARAHGRALFDTHVCIYSRTAQMHSRIRALEHAGLEVGGSMSQWFAALPDGHILELSDAVHAQLEEAMEKAAIAPAAVVNPIVDADVFVDAVTNADTHGDIDQPRVVHLDVFVDPICPWVAMTSRTIARVRHQLPKSVQLDVRYHPFILDPRLPDFPEATTKRARYTAKRGYPVRTWAERTTAAIERFNKEAGVAFTIEGEISSSVPSLRLLALAEREGGAEVQLALMDELVRAFHEEGLNLGDPEVLTTAARRAGLKTDVRAYLASTADVAEVAREAAAASARGVRGVPTLCWSANKGHTAFTRTTGSLDIADMSELVRELAS